MPVRPENSDEDATPWEEPTEELSRPQPEATIWPGDDRKMVRISPDLRMDATPVSWAAWARFCAETGHAGPVRNDNADDTTPVVNVSMDDSRKYARWAKKRLPFDHEWTIAMRQVGLSNAGGGIVWEWTVTRQRKGHVVRGGPFRDRPGQPGAFANRSWEDRPCPDVGFRCVVDG